MKRLICFFEDNRVADFYPLSLSHTPAEFLCGILSLGDKWSIRIPHEEIRILSRSYLKSYLAGSLDLRVNDFAKLDFDEVVLINPRFLADDKAAEQLQSGEGERALYAGESLVGVATSPQSDLFRKLSSGAIPSDGTGNPYYELIAGEAQRLARVSIEVSSVRYLWDLVHINSDQTRLDFEFLVPELGFSRMFDEAEIDEDALIYNLDDVYIGKESQIDGQVVIDARPGPVYIGEKVYIAPHTRLEGPAYIGDNCQLVGGKIRSGCSFGSHCRIGGEVEESIFLGYSNKYHDGFIGHAYVGEWVNFGALTTNSDLKNNYGNIKVELPSGLTDTRYNKVGCLVGDHTKTGIGTLLTTGMVIGCGVNLFGGGLAGGRMLPSFVWGGKDGFVEHRLTEAVETAKIVMSRRGRSFTAEDESLFKYLFEQSKTDRERFLSGGK